MDFEEFRNMPPDDQDAQVEKEIVENQHKLLDASAVQIAINDSGVEGWSCVDPTNIEYDIEDCRVSVTFEWGICSAQDGSEIYGSATAIIDSDGTGIKNVEVDDG